MKVLLIAGKASSGKTLLGSLIKKKLEENKKCVLQTELSKYLKLYAYEILDYDGSRENKPRKFLQDTGVFIREKFLDEHFLTRRFLEDMRIYEEYFDVVIISDIRLIEEMDFLKEKIKHVTTIKVVNKHGKYPLDSIERNHITETELEDYTNFDYIIENENAEILNVFASKIIEEVI